MKFIKNTTRVFLLIGFIIQLNACKKIEQMAATEPVITTTNPTENAEFANGQMLQIKGQVTDNEGLSSFDIEVTDDVSKAVLFKISPIVKDLKTYNIDIPWLLQVNDWVEATMKISTVNNAGLKAEKVIHIKIWL
jgi:hypothetical protein